MQIPGWWQQIEKWWRVPPAANNGQTAAKFRLQAAIGLIVILALTAGYQAVRLEKLTATIESEEGS